MSMAQPWTERALCKDQPVHIWFPNTRAKGTRDPYAQARAICDRCPVAEPCLASAIERNEIHGMQGGWTPEERRKGRRVRRVPKEKRPGKKLAAGRRRFTDQQVGNIRKAYHYEKTSVSTIARRYGSPQSTIYKVLKGEAPYDKMSTRRTPSDPQVPRSMIGATEEAAPDAASTATEGLEARPLGGQDS